MEKTNCKIHSKPSIILVHGELADGSIRKHVIHRHASNSLAVSGGETA
jgi:hypothetical protein